MYLTIYNENLVALGIVDQFEWLIWESAFDDFGEFKLNAPGTENNLKLLELYNCIVKGDTNEIGYITKITVENDKKNGDVIQVSGKLFQGFLGQRVANSTASNLKDLIEGNLRGISNLIVDEKMVEIDSSTVNYGDNLGENILNLGKVNGFGIKTEIDKASRKILLSCYEGADKSKLSGSGGMVIFSDNFENLHNARYDFDVGGSKNTVYGRVEIGANVTYSEVPVFSIENGSGLRRFEEFVSVTDETYRVDGVTYLNYVLSMNKLKNKIYEKYSVPTEKFFGDVPIFQINNLKCSLGDIVTVENKKWKKSLSMRVSKLTEYYDNENNTLVPTFTAENLN